MKKLLVVLLSLGLIAAFCAPASALDVSFSGRYYVYGAYDDNPTAADKGTVGYSRAYIYQQLRVQPLFKVADGLSLTMRFDALEKTWGDTDWRRGAAIGDDQTSSRPSTGAASTNIQESIEFEQVYTTFDTAAGRFQIGYQLVGGWGTSFGDSVGTGARFLYTTKFGPLTILGIYEKLYEADRTNIVINQTKTDADNDSYALGAIYNTKGLEGGLLVKYWRMAAGFPATPVTPAAGPGRNGGPPAGATKFWLVAPYAKATFGPLFIEGEVNYISGTLLDSETAGVQDFDIEGWGAYLNAKMNLGPAYVGALYGYISGDDLSATATKTKGNILGGGTSFSPALVLGNFDVGFMGGGSVFANPTAGGQSIASSKYNSSWYSIYGGFNPMPKLNMEARLVYATVNKTLAANTLQEKDLGTELDLMATYKIYDNLSYMVAASYIWTGDWFKGNTPATTKVGNEYYLQNKLTLTF